MIRNSFAHNKVLLEDIDLLYTFQELITQDTSIDKFYVQLTDNIGEVKSSG